MRGIPPMRGGAEQRQNPLLYGENGGKELQRCSIHKLAVTTGKMVPKVKSCGNYDSAVRKGGCVLGEDVNRWCEENLSNLKRQRGVFAGLNLKKKGWRKTWVAAEKGGSGFFAKEGRPWVGNSPPSGQKEGGQNVNRNEDLLLVKGGGEVSKPYSTDPRQFNKQKGKGIQMEKRAGTSALKGGKRENPESQF